VNGGYWAGPPIYERDIPCALEHHLIKPADVSALETQFSSLDESALKSDPV